MIMWLRLQYPGLAMLHSCPPLTALSSALCVFLQVGVGHLASGIRPSHVT